MNFGCCFGKHICVLAPALFLALVVDAAAAVKNSHHVIIEPSSHQQHQQNQHGSERQLPRQHKLAVADLATTTGLTPSELVQNILGPGVVSSNNVIYTGAYIASGTFRGGTGIFGFEAGIVLTNGNASHIIGPNTDDSITRDNGVSGDNDLDMLVPGYTTHDASVLEFDFECATADSNNILVFEYVFASDEYNEYVDSVFNDVFGFFLNGVNVALIDPTTRVSIQNINCGNPYSLSSDHPHCDKFHNNDRSDGGPFFDTEMDGFTDVLVVNAPVNAGMNHMKLAIADMDDAYLDSAVLIKADSFSCIVPEIET